MQYTKGQGALKNWIVSEPSFNDSHLGKCETIMALGNGYLGVRSATEEAYVGEVRNTFVAGTFNKFDPHEVTELPNCADVFQITFEMDGCVFTLKQGEIMDYDRSINLKNGELSRKVRWKSPHGKVLDLHFYRFVSLNDPHLMGQRIELTAVDDDVELKVISGINGQMTNSGVQHFSEGEKRLFHDTVLQMVQHTTESHIDVVTSVVHRFQKRDQDFDPSGLIAMDRRQIYFAYGLTLEKNVPLTLEKMAYVVTTRDKDFEGMPLEDLRALSVDRIRQISDRGYQAAFEESEQAWLSQVWEASPITIASEDPMDQLSIRFAQYHLRIMTPYHDSRMNIGAKGLTGEGYKGHTFWDTEVFILPYYIYTHPQIARQLLEYRYLTLEGAHLKARENGFEGAMYPWESAWLTDGEVTPVWGAADIVTGKSTKIWSGFIEQHISADIAFAIWQYYSVSGDRDFMDRYGYEIIFDTAKFWASRLEFSQEDGLYHINKVIGPDEYKEHVDDNAFTNYMVAFNIELAIKYHETLMNENEDLLKGLETKLGLESLIRDLKKKQPLIYLPKPNEKGVVPQDKTYLSKAIIDLTPYKNQTHVGSLFKKYNLDQVNQMQISKQADVLILMYLLENKFSSDVKKACWEYYEPKTLHDSSLSLSTHSVLASDLNDHDLAYALYKRAAEIDLGPNMKSSDHGIHAASLGGLWQCIANGFAGIRMLDGKLRIEPHLPDKWLSLSLVIYWQGEKIDIKIGQNELVLTKAPSDKRTEIACFGKVYGFNDTIKIAY